MRNSGDKGNASENLRGGGGEGDRERGREGKKGSWGGRVGEKEGGKRQNCFFETAMGEGT